MQLNNPRWARGFTIIEILIVLAIAGLIMLVVFLAVPAMQRSSRNTIRKRDAGYISKAVSDFKTNNGNVKPNRLMTDAANATILKIGLNGSPNTETARLGFYNGGSAPDAVLGPDADYIFIDPSNPLNSLTTPQVMPTGTDVTNLDRKHISANAVSIIPGETCDATGSVAGVLDGSAVAIFYVLEDGSNMGTRACIEA